MYIEFYRDFQSRFFSLTSFRYGFCKSISLLYGGFLPLFFIKMALLVTYQIITGVEGLAAFITLKPLILKVNVRVFY